MTSAKAEAIAVMKKDAAGLEDAQAEPQGCPHVRDFIAAWDWRAAAAASLGTARMRWDDGCECPDPSGWMEETDDEAARDAYGDAVADEAAYLDNTGYGPAGWKHDGLKSLAEQALIDHLSDEDLGCDCEARPADLYDPSAEAGQRAYRVALGDEGQDAAKQKRDAMTPAAQHYTGHINWHISLAALEDLWAGDEFEEM